MANEALGLVFWLGFTAKDLTVKGWGGRSDGRYLASSFHSFHSNPGYIRRLEHIPFGKLT